MLLLLQSLPHKLSGILRDCRLGIVPCPRRLQNIESDTGYDTRWRVPDGARVSKADGSQSLDLQRVAGSRAKQ